MTYTYKLARRLAISRNLGMLTVLALLAACAGETTAPDAPGTPTPPAAPTAPVGFRVLPGVVTVETDQPVRFRGEVRTLQGQVYAPSLVWEASGGTIKKDGTFSAPTPGTYRVVGRGQGRGRAHPQRPDTSVVVVVRKRPGLVGIRVTPRTPELDPGQTRTFTATGQLASGSTAPIGVVWSATGGSIDAAGVYRAGNVEGTHQVVATNTRGTVADTIKVKVRRPAKWDTIPGPAPEPIPTPSPDPAPEPSPDPAPALARVVLKPANLALATSARHQFAAFGRTATGDSVAIDVTFRATGGTITSSGLYTAGPTTGTYRVIATSTELADTSVVTLAETSGGGTPIPGPTPVPTGTGIPMGLSALLSSGAEPSYYNMSLDGYTADRILTQLSNARAKKIKMLMNMTGGRHSNYMTDGVFDMAKWQAKMDSYNTPTIKAAVAQAVAEGIIVGNSVMDEPTNTSANNSWGPEGTMTKARVDGMCRYVKNIFPTLPVGVVHDHRKLEPEKGYDHCDFIVSQYRLSKGDVRTFRDGGLAFAKRAGISIAFSINVIHGGTPGTDCDKWGDDPNGVLCPMSPEQVRDFGLTLGTVGCALNMWRYEKAYHDRAEIQRALQIVAESLAKLPQKPCRRP